MRGEERAAVVKKGIMVSHDVAGGLVIVKNCKEVWAEVKSLGFDYDLERKVQCPSPGCQLRPVTHPGPKKASSNTLMIPPKRQAVTR